MGASAKWKVNKQKEKKNAGHKNNANRFGTFSFPIISCVCLFSPYDPRVIEVKDPT